MADLEIGELRAEELGAAAALLARAYRDNAWMVALLGDDQDLRERVMCSAHRFRISALEPPAIVARSGGELMGICGFDAPAATTARSQDDQVAFVKIATEAGPDVLPRLMEMLTGFGRRAPAEPHWHLGPVGVSVNAQKRGIGSRMLELFCGRLDGNGDVCFLETEEPDNVRLYEKFGWVVTDEAKVLGVPGWFMLRHPRR
jgi:ribosomal protein S18 acetylase RimI-like enzyme